MELHTINEIENVTSVSSPHEEELKKFGEKWRKRLRKLSEDDIDRICELLKGQRDSLGMGEEWTLTKEFYPGVRTHISYHYHGEEFSEFGEEDAVRFLFSGDRVQKITGEDLAGGIEVLLNFIEKSLEDESLGEKKNWEMKSKYSEARESPFKFLKKDDLKEIKELSDFLGSSHEVTESGAIFHKEVFKGVKAEINLEKNFEIDFSGDNLEKLTNHDLDFLSVFLINHIIRFIAMKHEGENLPIICEKVFPK